MKAIVRRIQGDSRLQISLKYPLLESDSYRTFNLYRLQNEEVSKTFERLSANIIKERNKKLKKKKKNVQIDPPISICIMNDGHEVDLSVANVEGFSEGNTLVIEDNCFNISVNPPVVTALTLPKTIMAGFRLYPKIELEFSDLNCCKFTWFINIDEGTSNDAAEATNKLLEESWEVTHQGFEFTPGNDLIGRKLKLQCVPYTSNPNDECGEKNEVISDDCISAAPGICPFMTRHCFTKDVTLGTTLRVVTYNILADMYADSDYSRDQLYPYCPAYALAVDYRKQLYTIELVGYNADIICLQECDRKVFIDHLLPIFEIEGFVGVMKTKGQVPEGTAIFYRKNKFTLVASHDIELSDSLKNSPLNKELYDKVCQSEGLKDRVLNRQTSLQIMILQSTEDAGKNLLVATTHLFWHPKAPHVRMIQTAVCFTFIEELLSKYDDEGLKLTVIFAGDLNTEPQDGNTSFITENVISADHHEWMKCGESEYVSDINLRHSLKLESACGYPQFTNYTGGYKGCLDYIYINKDKLKVQQVVPLPCDEEVSLHTALPSVVCPSDHLPLICDLEWIE